MPRHSVRTTPLNTSPNTLPRVCLRTCCAVGMLLLLVMAVGACGRNKPTPVAQAPTAAPTFTPLPTATLRPAATATPRATATPSPTATRTPVATAVAGPALPASDNPGLAQNANERPYGSSVRFEPEFPDVSPVGEPPIHDEHTNPLSGVTVEDPDLLARRPILLRYGNDRAARPHAGIAQAEVVMEDLMEAWWITRLTAVFLQEAPDRVGPVRSARPVNIEMTPALDGVFTFSGASNGMWGLLNASGLDLVYDGRDGDLFYRSGTKAPPHNLYTSIPDIRERLEARGIERPATLRGLAFSEEVPPDGVPAGRVDVPLPPSSVVAWTWDPEVDAYRRWVQGQPYTDEITGEQIACENVIVVYAKHWMTDIVEDANGATAIGLALRGGGRVQIFRDGLMYEGYWWREEREMLFQFIDAEGEPIPLKPGHSWIQFVPTTYEAGVS
ncbi:MAG: DUF3048 domain-containing protein [Chloroflexi bacterium]|nr:DUF3048 domain-containing protein [Chloroflexota bacterium]